MNTVIYYPHFYPTPNWLKLAALCWDKVYTLAPSNVPDDPDIIQKLNNTLGGILDYVDIEPIANNPRVKKQFKKWVDARAERLKAQRRSSEEVEVLEMVLYYSKFPGGDLVQYLERRGLARFAKFQAPYWHWHTMGPPEEELEDEELKPIPGSAHEKYESLIRKSQEMRGAGDFKSANTLQQEAEKIWKQNLVTMENLGVVYLPKDIGLHYLSLCASKAAERKKSDLVAGSRKFLDSVFYNPSSLRGEVATSVLQAYLPKNFFSLEPQRIAEFRSEFATQRLKYQKEVQSIVDEFATVASEGQLEVLKKNIVDIAKERVNETKKTYKRAKLDTMIKAFGISLTPPALVAYIASVLGIGIFAPIGVAIPLSLFAVQSLLDLEKAKLEKNKSPWSYVLNFAKIH